MGRRVLKQFGDTPNFSTPSLCVTCRNGQNVKGQTSSDELTLCHAHGCDVPIQFPVVQCSEYDDKRMPSIWEMEKIAWRFSVDNKRKKAGFLSPQDYKAQRRAAGDDVVEE